MVNKMNNKKFLIFCIILVFLVNIPIAVAADGINNTDILYEDEGLIDMGTDEMPEPLSQDLIIDNSTPIIAEKDIKNVTEEKNSMVYLNSSNRFQTGNYHIAINNNYIYQYDKLIVHLETDDNQFIELPQNTGF